MFRKKTYGRETFLLYLRASRLRGARLQIVCDDKRRGIRGDISAGQVRSVERSGRNHNRPFIDRAVRIPLHQIVGWQTMGQEELEKNVIKIAMKMELKIWP